MGGGPFGFGGNAFDPSTLATHLWNQFNDSHPSDTENTNTATKSAETGDHVPDADIFDTESAYVVHISLPGARKEDVGVNWDAEKSELSVAGVIYRPGSEEFLKTLAMNERKVGPFERKIRLGTRASPAHIDADGIAAKLEDGVLRVEVPKLDSGFVEIRKVDIE
ncbi:HSP20-like chaperone [Decorospora gaudefroyi]|uniref:HSP20-like chaperone n=1 Tax=Decorospora gaudefroyi TaxID=184978 RepID=A0A6A5KSL9_9PLEO|nr:HSP20-like chaperone [Decorospora gaudefroyi]